MTELVKVKDESYSRYEGLLIRKDALRKEAYHIQLKYLKEFGDLINQLFEAKIRCIEKKKIIAYCQARVNKGERIDQSAMNLYISQVMKDYYAELHEMLEQTKALKTSAGISEWEYRKIKALYRKLAKILHPDMHPEFADDETAKGLWKDIQAAYAHNQLEELEELEVLVHQYLESIHYTGMTLQIPDIDEKIFRLTEEIKKIRETDPYQYKYLLADKEAIKEKKKELQDEIHEYELYAEELDEVIASFGIKRSFA